MAEHFTKFDYLLNAMLDAARQANPADHGYRAKREALYEHVRELERLAATSIQPPRDKREDAEGGEGVDRG